MAIFGKNKKTDEINKKSSKKEAEVKVVEKDNVEKNTESMKDLYKDQDKAKAEKNSAETEKKFKNAHKVLIRPLITEKAASVTTESKYSFVVDAKTNKIEIAKAINEVYGVKPISVNVTRVSGKKVRHGRHLGQRKDWKKAVVTLSKGKTISIYEGV